MIEIEKLSSSAYNTYSHCPWKFYLEYVLKMPSPSGGSALLGTIAHKVLELYSKFGIAKRKGENEFYDKELDRTFGLKPIPSYEDLWAICQEHYFLKEPHAAKQARKKTKRKKEIDSGVKWVFKNYNPYTSDTINVENRFKIPVKNKKLQLANGEYLKISGVIDRIDKIKDDFIEIIDYKTGFLGKFPPTGDDKEQDWDDLSRTIQANLYYYAAKRIYNLDKVMFTFLYLVPQKAFTFVLTKENEEIFEDKMFNRLMEIQHSDQFERNPNPPWVCKYVCPFGDKNLGHRGGDCQRLYTDKYGH